MKNTISLAYLATAAQASIINNIFARQTTAPDNSGYLDSVCSPNVTDTSGTLPPCISVINIQGQCAPNGTTPLAYQAMAQCLCNTPSTFFADWYGCRECLEFHGGLTGQDLARYSSVINSVSNAICTGTPTAQFADYFTSIAGAVAVSYSGTQTVTSDQAPSQTAVSLYYTAPGAQGPGSITGSAAAATRSGDLTVLSGTRTTNTARSTSTSARTSAAASGSASASGASSGSGAMPTAAYGLGLALAAAGGAIIL